MSVFFVVFVTFVKQVCVWALFIVVFVTFVNQVCVWFSFLFFLSHLCHLCQPGSPLSDTSQPLQQSNMPAFLSCLGQIGGWLELQNQPCYTSGCISLESVSVAMRKAQMPAVGAMLKADKLLHPFSQTLQ